MATLTNRVTKLEAGHISLDEKLQNAIKETERNREAIVREERRSREALHKSNNKCNNLLNEQREGLALAKELIMTNSHHIQLSNEHIMSLAEKQEDMRGVVKDNTAVMVQLKESLLEFRSSLISGLKVFMWIVASVGTVVSIFKLIELL